MKLIFCPECEDMVKLLHETRSCRCGKAFGKYLDDIRAEVGGTAVPIGIGNGSMLQAVRNRPMQGPGPELKAWVFPYVTENVRYLD